MSIALGALRAVLNPCGVQPASGKSASNGAPLNVGIHPPVMRPRGTLRCMVTSIEGLYRSRKVELLQPLAEAKGRAWW